MIWWAGASTRRQSWSGTTVNGTEGLQGVLVEVVVPVAGGVRGSAFCTACRSKTPSGDADPQAEDDLTHRDLAALAQAGR